MKISQNPFGLYDFLGYFTPGAFTILMMLRLEMLNSVLFLQGSIESNTLDYVWFVIASYVLGHLISMLSTLSVEKISIWRHGYPSKFLLLEETTTMYLRPISSQNKKTKVLVRLVMFLILLPITVWDWISVRTGLSKIKSKPFDNPLKEIIRAKIELITAVCWVNNTPIVLNADRDDFFNLVYHFVQENNKNHSHKIYNYVALYGFFRSMSLIFVCLFWFAFTYHFQSVCNICRADCAISMEGVFCVVSSIFVCITFYEGYRKFLRRYTAEVLLTAAILDVPKFRIENQI